MAQRKLDHFLDLSQLLTHSTNVIIADLIEISFLIFSFNWITFTMNYRRWSDYARWTGVNFNNLKNKFRFIKLYLKKQTLNSTVLIAALTVKVSPL